MNEDHATAYRIHWIQKISDIEPTDWNGLLRPESPPFLEWEWLRLMETSGSTSPEKGWMPCHLVVRHGERLVAAAPLYLKAHSAGEFVFDHVWVDVARRLGVSYYPKLVGMSPFTPATGYRFLVAGDQDEPAMLRGMTDAIEGFCTANRLSGCSFHYVDPRWRASMEALGYRPWMQQSFSWTNAGYGSFEEFLGRFKANQRRNIRRERRAMSDQGISLAVLEGDEIPEAFFPQMYRLYSKTNDQFGVWGCKYLTPEFFSSLHGSFRHRLVTVAAFNGDEGRLPVAQSLLLRKGDRLWGRYWGTFRDANALHFNACYYRPIEWAIDRGVRTFDPGIGGAHKVRRGFEAVANHSLHRFFDPRLQQVMDLHIEESNRHESRNIDAINEEIPFARRA